MLRDYRDLVTRSAQCERIGSERLIRRVRSVVKEIKIIAEALTRRADMQRGAACQIRLVGARGRQEGEDGFLKRGQGHRASTVIKQMVTVTARVA